MRQTKSLRERVDLRIKRSRASVFLPREFNDLGGEDQVGWRQLPWPAH